MPNQTLGDAEGLRKRLRSGRRAVVVGGRLHGLEFAAVANSPGLDVTVVAVAERVLARAASAEYESTVSASHTQRGTRLLFSCGVSSFKRKDYKVAAVRTADGRELPADIVIVGIGAGPRLSLRPRPGWKSATVSTSSDCFAPTPPSPQSETWRPFRRLDDEQVVLADSQSRARTVLYIRDERLAAVETIDRAGDHILLRRLLAKGVRVTRAEAQALGIQLEDLT